MIEFEKDVNANEDVQEFFGKNRDEYMKLFEGQDENHLKRKIFEKANEVDRGRLHGLYCNDEYIAIPLHHIGNNWFTEIGKIPIESNFIWKLCKEKYPDPKGIKVLDYGCFVKGTKVLTGNLTYKNIEDIKKGNAVITHKGNVNKVNKIFDRKYNKKIISIKCTGLLEELNTTEEHPILGIKREEIYRKNNLIKGDKKLKFINASDIKKGDYVAVKLLDGIEKKYIDINDFTDFSKIRKSWKPFKEKIKLNDDFMWLLGLFLAEGSFVYGHEKLVGMQVSLGLHEHDLVEKAIRVFTKELEKPYVEYRENKNIVEIKICNKRYGLLFFELCSRYADKVRIHESLLSCKNYQLINLIKGFVDGDGFLDKSRSQYGNLSCKTISRELGTQLSYLLNRMGLPHNVTIEPFKGNAREVYRINFSLEATDFILKREKAKKRKYNATAKKIIDGYMLLYVKNVKKQKKSVNVYNLEVNKDNSYIVNNICVHNCGPGLYGIRLALEGYDVTLMDVRHKFFEFLKFIVSKYNVPNLSFESISTGEHDVKDMYDYIICSEMLEHCDEPEQVLQHLMSHLKVDNWMYLSTFFDDMNGHDPSHLKKNTEKFNDFNAWLGRVVRMGLFPFERDQCNIEKGFKRMR